MNQNERVTAGPSCQNENTGPAILPSHNSPVGDPVTQPDGGDEIKPGQPNVAGIDPGAGESDEDGSTIQDPADSSRDDRNGV